MFLVTVAPVAYVLSLRSRGEGRVLMDIVLMITGMPPSDTDLVLVMLGLILGFFVPLLAVSDASDAIVAEREDRTIKLLLTLPNSRRQVLLGKAVARFGLLAVPLAGGLVVIALVAGTLGIPLSLRPLAALGGLSLLLLLCFVFAGVAASSLTRRTSRAVYLGLGVYVNLVLAWPLIQLFLLYLTTGRVFPTGGVPPWFGTFGRLSPMWAYEAALEGLLTPGLTQPLVSRPPAGTIVATGWFPLGVLLAWLVGFLLVGLFAVGRADFG